VDTLQKSVGDLGDDRQYLTSNGSALRPSTMRLIAFWAIGWDWKLPPEDRTRTVLTVRSLKAIFGVSAKDIKTPPDTTEIPGVKRKSLEAEVYTRLEGTEFEALIQGDWKTSGAGSSYSQGLYTRVPSAA